ncbi:hypothetical protein A3A67_00165 [Candidatus Peribacteria bacterium RIFCSPLOWO2_01_FULL_51_18]|nr:MAG: hypothetical protein A3A67_00165 [Candidatus Peribacteria bacterium RIFCSPLOWO2_01_FULL_51_18]
MINFGLHTALDSFSQVSTGLRRHAELDVQNQRIFRRKEGFVRRDDFFDLLFLKQPDDVATVDHVSCQTIKFPAKDSLCLAFLDALDHLRESFPPRGFGGLLISDGVYDFQMLFLGNLRHDSNLIVNRLDLLLFVLGGFASVKEILHGR